jgi:uncharacterized protein YhdP
MRWNHHFRVSFIILLSVILISAAVIFSVLRAALPYATGYKSEIQQEISRQIGLPVEIGSIDAAIHWFSPRLKLLNVSVFDKDHKLHLFDFEEAFVELDTTVSLLRGELIVGDVGLVGTKIAVEKLSDNEWLVQGIKFSSEGENELPEQFLYMLKNSDYLLYDSDIHYQDHTGDKLNVSLLDVNINVVNKFNTHNIKISTNLSNDYGKDLAIVANLKGDFDSLYGDVYIEANAVNVNRWNTKFQFLKNYQVDSIVDVAVWGTLQGNEISRLTTHFAANDVAIKNRATNKTWRTNFFTANIDYVQGGKNRQLSVSNFYFGNESQPEWGKSINLLSGEDKNDYYFNADFVRLNELHNIAEVIFDGDVFDATINEQYKKIKSYALQGDIYNLHLRLAKQEQNKSQSSESKPSKPKPSRSKLPDPQLTESSDVKQSELQKNDSQRLTISQSKKIDADTKDFLERIAEGLYVDATVYDFSMDDALNKLSIKGIDAVVHHEKNVTNITFHTKNAVIGLNKLFRAPLIADVISGDISLMVLSNDGEAISWEVNSEQLQIKNQDINTFTRLNFQAIENSPIKADVQTDFYGALIKHTHKYLPVGIMKKGLVSWLDTAVTNGYVPSGQFILNGNLKDFPYRENDGVFQVLFSAEKFDMKFLDDWPLLKNTSAQLRFNSMSLDVTNVISSTQNTSLYAGSARIENLADAYINIIANARGRNTDIQSYIWNSPLDNKLGDTMRLFQIGGGSNLNLKIGVPLNNKDEEVVVDGRLIFDNADIYYPEMGYAISQINGTLDFTNDTIFSDSMDAYIEGNPILLSANTHATDTGKEITFNLKGILNANYLLQRYKWVPDNWLSGSSFWSIDFNLPSNNGGHLLRMNARSSLDNVVINVSDAVHKSATEEVNLNAEINVLKNNKLTMNVKASDAGNKIFNVDAKLSENKVWNIDIDSEYLDGVAEFTADLDKHSQITLDLEKINLSALLLVEGEGESKKSLNPADFPALDWKAKNVIWKDWHFTKAVLKTDWNQYGMLINTFTLKSIAFAFDGTGSWLTSSNTSSGLPSKTSVQGMHETVLQGTVTSKNVGDALTTFGYERSINRSGFDSKFLIKWPAEPYALTWEKIKGDVSFSMENGEIIEVEPGAGGRLLGLMNIFKLANRLAFNFDDVYRKGFSFDSIEGALELSGGQGSLKKFDISAPAADVDMFGSIGLVKQDYNLLMHVKPHTDTLTFAGGVLVGGVVVGAGLALIQKIFDLGVIGHNVYSITGSWSDPVTEEIVEKTQSTSEDDDQDEL